jgi:uncharacterized protein YbaR (Trm112 family)
MHIELTEMLRCPEEHREEYLVLSTSEMNGRMVMLGVVGCPVCQREFEIIDGIVDFTEAITGERQVRAVRRTPAARSPVVIDAQSLQALLDLGGPGGYVILLGSAARHAEGLASQMGGVHFVGINAPPDVEELPILSLLQSDRMIPLRQGMARAVVVGAELAATAWVADGIRVLLRGRRLVVESALAAPPEGVRQLASGEGVWVGEKK